MNNGILDYIKFKIGLFLYGLEQRNEKKYVAMIDKFTDFEDDAAFEKAEKFRTRGGTEEDSTMFSIASGQAQAIANIRYSECDEETKYKWFESYYGLNLYKLIIKNWLNRPFKVGA